jgi:hypothetical protein
MNVDIDICRVNLQMDKVGGESPFGNQVFKGSRHRVVEIRSSPAGALVVTKGDAVPRSDPPVPLSMIEYVVVARVPRLVVAVAALAVGLVVLYRCYYRLLRLVHGAAVFVEPGAPALIMIAVYVAFNFVYLGLGYVDLTSFSASLPGVEEHIVYNISAFKATVKVVYDEPLEPATLPSCSVRGYGPAPLLGYNASSPGVVVYTVELPRSYFLEEWVRLSREKPPLRATRRAWRTCSSLTAGYASTTRR